MEYVYQKLNGHPSNYWLNLKQNRKAHNLNFYNTDPRNIENIRFSVMNKSAIDEEAKKPDQNMTTSFELYRAQSEHSLLSDYIPDHQVKIDSRVLSRSDLKKVKTGYGSLRRSRFL